MTQRSTETDRDWQLQHYANVGKDYGNKHFTQADNEFTTWILGQIASVNPVAKSLAEIGAGTCVFASLLGKQLGVEEKVTCYEPVPALLEAALEYENVDPTCGGAVEFAEHAPLNCFDLIYTKDTAHHFAKETLNKIHQGICDKLTAGGRYAMVVRTPPNHDSVPVGEIASKKWPTLYTSVDDLIQSLRGVSDWTEIEVTRWEKYVSTSVAEWIEGIHLRDTWSVFSALSPEDTEMTTAELLKQFDGDDWFPFLHQYDVAIFEKA